MPKVKDLFPSQYASGEDLNGKSFVATISHLKKEEMFDKQKEKKVQKWVMYLKNAAKGILLSKTTAEEIEEITGEDDTDRWKGKEVELYPTNVKAFGKMCNVIRFRKPTAGITKHAPATLQEVPEEEEGVEKEQETEAKHEQTNQVPLYDILESRMIQIELDDDAIEFAAFTENEYPRFNEISSVVQREKLEKFYQRLKVVLKR